MRNDNDPGTDGARDSGALGREFLELRRSEALLRDFIETSTISLHWVGADGTILWANQAELDLLGYTREEYIGRNIAEFHADEAVINDILACLSRGETLRDYLARLRHRDGSIRHVLINSSVLFEDGKFVHTRCFTRDVTALVQAQEASRLLSAVVESSGDAIYVYYFEGEILTWNHAAEEFYGYSQAEVLGRSVDLILHADRMTEVQDSIEAAIRARDSIRNLESTRKRRDGDIFSVVLTLSPKEAARRCCRSEGVRASPDAQQLVWKCSLSDNYSSRTETCCREIPAFDVPRSKG